ncbi:hypothetical protein IAU60_005507 [Kwoniella sp. DSM 27419]
MPDPFGWFRWICGHTALPQCNLFFAQLYRADVPALTTLFPDASRFFAEFDITSINAREDPVVQAARGVAGTGVGSTCEIAKVGHRGSVGDIALMVAAGVSFLIAVCLVITASRRKAAVGRAELRIFLLFYAVHSLFKVLTTSSLFEQGGLGLAVMSSIGVAVDVAMFWVLLGNALVATQAVEDGTVAALAPLILVAILLFLPTLYISLDTSLVWSKAFGYDTKNPEQLKNITLFVLTLIWPAFAVLSYTLIMLYVSLIVLQENTPALMYSGAFVLFAVGQVVFFLSSEPLCKASSGRVNSSFITALLETAAVWLIYLAWKSITEDVWGEDLYGFY